MHHPKADIERLYVKRKEGGRNLLQNKRHISSENRYCGIFEPKIYRRPDCKYFK